MNGFSRLKVAAPAMQRACYFFGILLLGTVAPSAQAASADYTYDGNTMTMLGGWGNCPFPCRVRAEFTFESPLPGNLLAESFESYLDLQPSYWRISIGYDQPTVFDSADPYGYLIFRLGATDAARIPTYWEFSASNGGDSGVFSRHTDASSFDSAYMGSEYMADVQAYPGRWELFASPVPEPAPITMLVAGAALLGLLPRRKGSA